MPVPRPLLPLVFLLPFPALAQEADPARDLVDPFVGTGGHGHTFPGACVPNGLVQLSPDTRADGYNDWDGCGGYHYSDSVIHGFSHTHLSGTGVADLCDVLLTPLAGEHGASWLRMGHRQRFDHAGEQAHAGYYRVRLLGPPAEDGAALSTRAVPGGGPIDAELTAATHTGVHRYTFPKGEAAYVVLDLRHRDQLIASSIRATAPDEVVGERRSSSWARDQHLYFCIRFSAPFTADVMPSDLVDRAAGFRFGTLDAPLIVKVGISAVSVEGARKNLEAEVPGWDFDAVRKQAEEAWNAKLRKIVPQGGTREQLRIFYTALYHCYVAPYRFNDVDGAYRGMDGAVHHADHDVYTVFSLWDTFRALHPLITLLEPDMTNDFIRTFLLHYQQGGRLPVWELWGNETDCMIGYHSVSVIADAYLKGIRGFDAELALKAMVASAMRDEPGLNAYRAKGYISSEDAPESVSKTLEYAYDDWCIAQMAQAMGRDSLASVFYRRSRNWQNLFDPRSGFFRARYNGGFKEPFDPYEVNFNFTEANAWQYSLFVPHDLPAFAGFLGGKDSLEHRLDRLFSARTATTGREQSDITGLIGQYAHGNEPSHHMAYLYDFTGHPEKTDALVARIMRELYRDAPDGLAGNEDCGQMSAWYVMSALGLYPVAPGCDRYWVDRWAFDDIHWSLPGAAKRWDGPTKQMAAARTVDPWPSVTHGALLGPFPWLSDIGKPIPQEVPDLHGWPAPDAFQVPPAPIISAGSASFQDSLRVAITCAPGPWSIRYAPWAEKPKTYMRYEGPFTLHDSQQVNAAVFGADGGGPMGPVVPARFTKVEGRMTITLESPYAHQYAAGGDRALIDGLRGGRDFRTGEWQGFHDIDVVATIDLGAVKKLQRVGLSVLQDQGAWIWYPAQVQYAWSTNGRMWSSATVANAVPREADGAQTQVLWTPPIGKKARFIKVIATNAGPCPAWHPGKGGKSWIFTDELLIEAE